jgi:hypothetical protein
MKKLIFFLFSVLFSFHNVSAQSPGRYYLRLANGRALEAESNTFQNNGCKIQIWNLYHGLNQLWEISDAGNGRFYIKNVGANKNLDAQDVGVHTNGCKVQLWQSYPANVNQQWIFQPLGANRFTIRCAASNSNKVLDVTGGIIDRGGTAVQLWDAVNGTNQVWNLERANDQAIVSNNLVDLRGNQTPYRSQILPAGERGGCTYFGSIAALEAAYKKRGYGELDLSEEFMAICSKMMYLHPYWPDISHANYRENQFAGTQGGGSIAILAAGLSIPQETVVPYGLFTIGSDWDTRDMKVSNNFNFSVWKRFPQIANATYYGVTAFEKIPTINAENFERVLSLGYEIKICIDGGSHCVLIVGFDKTNPAAKQFILKNSYGPNGQACNSRMEYFPYSEISRMVSAEYITNIKAPSTWDEIKTIGRWDLTYGGWKGTLDLDRLPGITQFLLNEPASVSRNGGALTDRRLGVFYDQNNKAHRVNGTVTKIGGAIELVFCIDNAKPNLRYDDFSGRKFRYLLSADGNSMSGSHIDLDGRSFPGTAIRN